MMMAGTQNSLVRELFGGDQRYAQFVEELFGFADNFGLTNVPLTLKASIVFSGSLSCGFPAPSSGSAWVPSGYDFQSFRLEADFGPREGDARNVAAARLGELLMRDIDKQYIALTSGDGNPVEVLRNTIILCDSRVDSDFDRLLVYLRRCNVRTDFAPELVKCDGVEWSGLERLLAMRPNATLLVERTLVKSTSWPLTFMERGLVESKAFGSVAHEYKHTVERARMTFAEKIIEVVALHFIVGLLLCAFFALIAG